MMIFEVKEIHITLLKNMYVDWNDMEFGAPTIDPKRPYGDSFVYASLSELCGIKGNEDYEFTNEQYNYMKEVHKETKTVLQIFLKTGKMEPGIYQASDYSIDWVKVG